jgi:acetoacetyl-CoA synthetase
METDLPDVLYTPDPAGAGRSRVAAFARHVGLDPLDYQALHRWSVTDLDGFWAAAADFLGVRFVDAQAGVPRPAH